MLNLANKALSIALICCILAVGVEAVQMSHVYFVVSFGDAPVSQVAMADTIAMSQLEPLPIASRPVPKRKP